MFYYLVVLCCLCLLIKIWGKKHSTLEPPEMSGRLPIVGHTHKIIGDAVHMYKAAQNIAEESLQNDGLVRLYMGPRKVYCVTDPEDSLTIANTCLKKHYFFDFMKPFLGNGLLIADVPTWKKTRKLLNPAFSPQVLGSFVEVFNTQAQRLVDQFAKKLGMPFDHEHLLKKNNLETICVTAFGVDASKYGDLQEKYLPRMTKIIKGANERMQKFWLYNDFIYNLTTEKKILDEELKHLHALSKAIIQNKRSERKSQSNKGYTGKQATFIDLIMDLAEDTGCFTDEQVRDETDNILAAGHDTTATILTFVLTLLGSYGDVQKKAYEEISHVLGNSERMVDKDDLPKLQYVEAILKETLRLYPILPLMPRCVDTDVKLRKYTIKANSECFLTLQGLHRHSIWGKDVDQFRPERWLDKETLPDPKYFGGFGLGRRSCIGKGYALMSMKITLAHVLRKFCISSDVSKMVVKMLLMPRPESGHHITLTLRNISDRD